MGKRRPDNASALQTEFDAHHVRLSSHRLFRDHLTPGTTDRVGDDHPAALGVTDDQSGSLSVTEPQVQRSRGMFIKFNGGLIMLHSGKARANREQQRQSLVQMIKAQQLRSNDLNCSYDTAADPRHVEFMQRKYQAAQ